MKIVLGISYGVFVIALFMVLVGISLFFYFLFAKKSFCSPTKNRKNDRNIKRWRKGFRRSLILLLVGVGMLWVSWQTKAFLKEREGSVPTGENAASGEEQDIKVIASEFGELQPNVTYTKWEEIVRENLDFAFYKPEKETKEYQNHNKELLLIQMEIPSPQRIQDLLTDFAEYFVEPTRTLEEIDALILTSENKAGVSAEIHKEEVMLYLGDSLENLDRARICQAGRASQEVVDCLYKEDGRNVKEILLYAALALELYRYALHMPSEGMTSRNKYDEFLLYRMGMLYETLAFCDILAISNNGDTYTYTSEYDHFLLEAESLFALASVTGAGKEGIDKSQIYYVDYYRGQVLFRLFVHMNRNDVRESAIECLQNFLEDKGKIPEAYQLPNAAKDCKNMLEILQEILE